MKTTIFSVQKLWVFLCFIVCATNVYSNASESQPKATTVPESRVSTNPVQMKRMESIIPRTSFKHVERADGSHDHEIVIAVKQNNLELLDEMLVERSTPGSSVYQEWLSFDEIGRLIDTKASHKAVMKWLKNIPGVVVTESTPRKEYIKARAAISVWEQVLDAEYHVYQDHSQPSKPFYHVAERYSIPDDLSAHIHTVFNTIQIPPHYHRTHTRPFNAMDGKHGVFKDDLQATTKPNGDTTIALLRSYYSMGHYVANGKGSQGVFETAGEVFSPSDLIQFNNLYGIPQGQPSTYNNVGAGTCANAGDGNCVEGNLDVQYIMGMAPGVATMYWYVDSSNPFLSWVYDVASSSNPSLVNSVSWGAVEQAFSAASLQSFNTEALKLGLMGVTVVVSSGDNGVANVDDYNNCLCNYDSSSNTLYWQTPNSWTGFGYFPSFPATSPYVTAVGATFGPNWGHPEVACNAMNNLNIITTGGGFSTYFSAPSWQASTTAAYFTQAAHLGIKLFPGYNPQGRGFPDVSLLGAQYKIVAAGSVISVWGTSASAPVFAAMVSIVNGYRLAMGNSSLGFLNPTLYSNAAQQMYNDIVVGNNTACAENPSNGEVPYCLSGFFATPGWDPVTGFGSFNFSKFIKVMEYNRVPLYSPAPSIGQQLTYQALSTGSIIGTVLGIICCIGIIGGVVYICYRSVITNVRLERQRQYANNDFYDPYSTPARVYNYRESPVVSTQGVVLSTYDSRYAQPVTRPVEIQRYDNAYYSHGSQNVAIPVVQAVVVRDL